MATTHLQGSLPATTQRQTCRMVTMIPSIARSKAHFTGAGKLPTAFPTMAIHHPSTRASRLLLSATAAPVAPSPSAPINVDENAVLDTVIVGAGVSGLTTAMVRSFFLPSYLLP